MNTKDQKKTSDVFSESFFKRAVAIWGHCMFVNLLIYAFFILLLVFVTGIESL